MQYGFRAVISTSFADIFQANSLKNSLLPIVVPRDTHATLFRAVEKDPAAMVTVDLAAQMLLLPNGSSVQFPIDGFSKQCLLNGVDELGYILEQESLIGWIQQQHSWRCPSWSSRDVVLSSERAVAAAESAIVDIDSRTWQPLSSPP